MKTGETIAAIATAMAPSGIGIIRMSGPESIAIAQQVFRPGKAGKILSEQKSHTVHYGYIQDEAEVLDEVLLLLLRAPHTYTREDTIEINTHGGILVMQRILHALLRHGACPAEPGEFTKRAFLNGRIDLAQAESVIDLIGAKNKYAQKSAVSQLRGKLSRYIRSLREDILYELARIESAIDDSEHYSLDEIRPLLAGKLSDMQQQIAHLLQKAEDGRLLKEGVRTVIIGKPNAGKSSLLNALLGEERAIVTEIAGTTRDVISEQIQLEGITLQIMDTAGVRQTADPVEQLGVQRTQKVIAEADLILLVTDVSRPLDENDRALFSRIKERRAIVLVNKTDLLHCFSKEMLQEQLAHPVLPVSIREKTGLDALSAQIKDMFFAGKISFNDEIYITNLRQKHALEQAQEALLKTAESLSAGMPEDFLTIDLMDAYSQLGYLIGEEVEDDLVDKIFAEFCMGK